MLDALNHYAKVPDLGIDVGDLLGDLGLGDLSLQFTNFLDGALSPAVDLDLALIDIVGTFDTQFGCATADTLNVLRLGLDKEQGFTVDAYDRDNPDDGSRSFENCFTFPEI